MTKRHKISDEMTKIDLKYREYKVKRRYFEESFDKMTIKTCHIVRKCK